jgi:hypothetical protein
MHTGVMVSIDYSRCLVRLLTSLQGFRRMLKRNAPSRLSISQNYLETSRFHVKTLWPNWNGAESEEPAVGTWDEAAAAARVAASIAFCTSRARYTGSLRQSEGS